MSNVKIEATAINAVRNLINLSNCMTSDEIKEGDRGVSFDGCIPIYMNSKITKENFNNKIDIQVKGRSVKKLSLAKQLNFSISLSDIKNYKNVGGTIIFYVQVSSDRTKYRIYVKSLLPYEINQLLHTNSTKHISLQFEYIDNTDAKKLEYICNQFQCDKDKQYSYKEDYKTIDDFKKEDGMFILGTNINSISMNPIEYLNKKSFIYFQPENYNNIQIPCGIALISSFNYKKNMDIKIGDEIINTIVEIKHFSEHIIVNINDCIFYNSKNNMFTFVLNSNLNKILFNIELIRKFIKYEIIIIGNNKLSIKSGGDYSIFEHQVDVIKKLDKIVKTLGIDTEPIIDFKDIESIKNIGLVYNNLIDKKGIPFINEYDIFLLVINIFNLKISFFVQKREDKTYDLYNLYDLLISEKDLFSYIDDKKERVIIYPNFSILNKSLNLDVSYLIADNIVDKLNSINITKEKVLNNVNLEANLNCFILDSLEYYDKNPNDYRSKLLLKFLEDVSRYLLQTRDKTSIDVYYINYCQVLKRLNKLSKDEIKKLVLIRENSSDILLKTCTSILLEDQSGFEIYFNILNDKEKQSLKSFPIINLKKIV